MASWKFLLFFFFFMNSVHELWVHFPLAFCCKQTKLQQKCHMHGFYFTSIIEQSRKILLCLNKMWFSNGWKTKGVRYISKQQNFTQFYQPKINKISIYKWRNRQTFLRSSSTKMLRNNNFNQGNQRSNYDNQCFVWWITRQGIISKKSINDDY